MTKKQEYIKEIITALKKRKLSKDKLSKLKLKLCSKYRIKHMPTDIEILMSADSKDLARLTPLLQTKPTRSISGVAVVAVMTKPIKCKHGACVMCPGGPKSVFGSTPQSYTGREPAARRALRNKFDPYLQMFNRLEQYIVTGHVPDKVELIIMGGTFPSFPKSYQERFVTDCFKAMNDFSSMFFKAGKMDIVRFKRFFELPGKVDDKAREKSIIQKILKLKSRSKLEKEQIKNEKSNIRCVGMTIETRPDYGKLKHGNEMLRLGCTRVELGIQSIYDDVLKKIGRGHSVKESIESIKALKDLGFKLNFHMMPGLPGVSFKKDLAGLKALFEFEELQPDMLKIYPCMVVQGTKLYKLWKKGKFKPLTTKKAAELIFKFKEIVPPYVRIMRVQRDIPTYMTEAGVDMTNLRQFIQAMHPECSCIRCREIGRKKKKGKAKIITRHYKSSGGNEFFISAESKKALYGFCRLRFPGSYLRKEISDDSVLIRELHVYGQTAGIGEKSSGKVQHQGLGKKLLEKAEEIAKMYFKKKIVIISAVGTREYYKKLGYKKEGVYMVKNF